MATLHGVTGDVTFDGNQVIINRHGFMIGRSTKTLHISQISAVQTKKATNLVNGFVQFTVPGEIAAKSQLGHRTTDAAHDENSIVYTKKNLADAEALAAEVNAAITQTHQPAVSAPPAGNIELVGDQLTKLATLLQQGIITQDDFNRAKAKLLLD